MKNQPMSGKSNLSLAIGIASFYPTLNDHDTNLGRVSM